MLSRKLCKKKFQTLVVSPRSYFVFTPLLSGTAVGTLEFRNVLEPVRNRRYPNLHFMQAWADDVDFSTKTLRLEESFAENMTQGKILMDEVNLEHTVPEKMLANLRRKKKIWNVKYDKLVVAVGCYSNTFGTKGVREHAYFLKNISDARKIRNRVLQCFETAALPSTNEEMKRRLLHFAIVGGGPTGMEFSAELSDFIRDDVTRLYPNLQKFVRMGVYDVAPKVLSMFDENLGKYAMETFKRQNIEIKTGYHVEELRLGLPKCSDGSEICFSDAGGCYTLVTKEDGEMGVGMVVWSTGNMMNPFIKKALGKVHGFPSASALLDTSGKDLSPESEDWVIKRHLKTGALIVDGHLRVQLQTKVHGSTSDLKEPTATAIIKDVFAIGDNAIVQNANLPATAQTANQEAAWLAKHLNKNDIENHTFTFQNMGIMAYLGDSRSVLQTGGGRMSRRISGRLAWLVWRGAYLTKSVSVRNKILIPIYW